MTDSEALDAEYRAFVRSLHPATVGAFAAVEAFWTQKLSPSATAVAVRGVVDQDSDSYPLEHSEEELDNEWRHEIRTRLSTLVYGHPDPEVREAADFLHSRISAVFLYLDPHLAGRGDGEESRIASDQVYDGIAKLARAIYHAPFRTERPEPRFEGIRIGNNELLPSQLVSSQAEVMS